MIFEGLLSLYTLTDTAEKGMMPAEKLVKLSDEYYGNRSVGITRYYAALGVNHRVDRLVRIWRNDQVQVNDYVILEDGFQYRIDFVQHLLDEDGLEVTDLTLVRLDDHYDVAGETIRTV